MVSFKNSGSYHLSYNKEQFDNFLKNEEGTFSSWFGVSFQLPGGYEGKDVGLDNFLRYFEGLFEMVVTSMDDGSDWTVNHEYKDLEWFPNEGNSLQGLRELFKANKVPNSFKGALAFSTNDLLSYTKELISYPHTVFGRPRAFYSDLNISHGELPLIIKISAHLNIDFLTTDLEFLKKIVNECAKDPFIVRAYRGTSLL